MSRLSGTALAVTALAAVAVLSSVASAQTAVTPRERAIHFLTHVCRPEGTYLQDRCGSGEEVVSPRHSAMGALALLRSGQRDSAAAILDWLRARQPAAGEVLLAYNGPAGAPLDAGRAEAEDLASMLLAGAELAEVGAVVDHPWLDGLATRLLDLRRPDGRIAAGVEPGTVVTRGVNAQSAAALVAWSAVVRRDDPARANLLSAAAERTRGLLRGEVAGAGPLNRRSASDFLWGLLWGGQTADGADRDRSFFREVGWEASPAWGARGQPGDGYAHPAESFDWARAQANAGDPRAAHALFETWTLLQRADGGFPEWVDLYTGERDQGVATSSAAARFLLAERALAQAGLSAPAPASALPPLLDATAVVRSSFDLILDVSIGLPEPARLVRAAWSAASNATPGGLGPPPAIPEPREQAWETFERAFQERVMTAVEARRVHPRYAATQAVLGLTAAVGDCHTGYFPNMRGALDRFVTEEEGVGIGAELLTGGVVKRVVPGGPADLAGLRPGDTLVSVDGVPYEMGGSGLVEGQPETRVTLVVSRPGVAESLVVLATRRPVVQRFAEGRLVAPGVGYLRIRRFSDGLEGQVTPILEGLAAQGARRWVVDLRDNGGGTVDELQRLAGKFLPPERTLFWDLTRAGLEPRRPLGTPLQIGAPVVILVNRHSFSASEIFAAAFRDAGWPVAGSRTGGCVGTGQAFYLPDGSGLQVTIARMLTAVEKRSLDRVGLNPDMAAAETESPAELAAGRDGPLDAALGYLDALSAGS